MNSRTTMKNLLPICCPFVARKRFISGCFHASACVQANKQKKSALITGSAQSLMG
ncbi:MAG: hypothetical protein ACJAT6_000305 [Akkermansiaceae bacterium]|jgi:hypothetical protein